MSKQLRILAPSLFSIATVIGFPSWAVEPSGSGWQSLFDGETIGSEWEQVGESNWRVEDGAIVADERSSETPAHLRTKASYKDVEVYAEFWASDDANSGIFLLNGEKTVELTDDTYTEGPLTLQHATGVIKFRKVAIRPL